MNHEILVVGSYVQDLSWRCGEFPRPGETVVGRFALGPGGKGSNQAVAAARAGAAACFVGAVGRDPFATAAREFYRREKIAARLIEKPGHATGTAAILVDARGENQIVVALGANAALAPGDVAPALIRRSRVVVAQLESNLATTTHVLRRARAVQAVTVLNPAPLRAEFDPRTLEHVDALIPNEPEFVALLARQKLARLTEARLRALPPRRLHEFCRALRVPVVIVTLGARGCFVSQPDAWTAIAGHRGLEVVDTTGAGDAFVGAFAAGLVQRRGDILSAARFANAAAALSVTRPGTASAMPRAREIARFLR